MAFKPPKKPYKRILFEDRKRIEAMCAEGKQLEEMAFAVGINYVTLYRALKRGEIEKAPGYSAEVAQQNIGIKEGGWNL